MAATLREHPPHPIYSAHIWDLKKPGYLLVYNIFIKKEITSKKSPNIQDPFTTYFCKTRNQIPFLRAYPLPKLEMSFRRKKEKKPTSLLIYQKTLHSLSKKAFATTQDWSFYFKCKTLVWKGSTAEGLYKFFLLLFSISFAYASQNYKILVGEMQKARFHIPKRSISMCCIRASWPPRKARQTHLGPPVLQLLTSSPSLSGLCPVFPMRNKHQARQAAKPVAASPLSLPWNSTDEQTCTLSSWEVVPSAKIFLINWPQERK